MAHELYTRTNQKIYFAGLALDSLRKAEEGQALGGGPGKVQAEREAALFHLYGALLGLCHEVAGYYRLAEANASRVELLLNQAVLKAAPSPEFAELVEMAQQPETWLAQLLSAYEALSAPPAAPKAAKVDPTLPLIQTVSVSDEPPVLTQETMEGWRQQLKLLALRFRESLSEC